MSDISRDDLMSMALRGYDFTPMQQSLKPIAEAQKAIALKLLKQVKEGEEISVPMLGKTLAYLTRSQDESVRLLELVAGHEDQRVGVTGVAGQIIAAFGALDPQEQLDVIADIQERIARKTGSGARELPA